MVPPLDLSIVFQRWIEENEMMSSEEEVEESEDLESDAIQYF